MSKTANVAIAPTNTDKPAEGEKKEEKSVKLPCISQERFDHIFSNFRTLHGHVIEGLREVGVTPKFHDKWDACNGEDYKLLHEQARILIRQRNEHVWTTYAQSVTKAIKAVVDTYMVQARKAKEGLDTLRENTPPEMRAFLPTFPSIVKVPMSALIPCFKGKSEAEILVELTKLFPTQVVNGAPKGQKETKVSDISVTFPFTEAKKETPAPAPTSEEKAPEAPVSGEVETAPASKAA
jgi:hypothetical protein